jgi:hypothetical protein
MTGRAKEENVRKWLPAIPILVGLGVSASVYEELPRAVSPDWSRVLPFVAGGETMGRFAFAVLIPMVAIVVWIGFLAGARVAGRRGGTYLNDETGAKAIARFEPTFAIVVTGVVGLLTLLHVALVASVAGWPQWTMQAVGVVLGVGTAAIGNLIPRVRPNWIVGIRTRATLSDPALWTRTHRYFGGLLMLVGIGVAILSPFASNYAFPAAITGFLLAAVLAHWFARARTTTSTVTVLVAVLMCAGTDVDAQNANHVFKRADSREPHRQVPLYRDRSLPIVPGLAPAIADWIRAVMQ